MSNLVKMAFPFLLLTVVISSTVIMAENLVVGEQKELKAVLHGNGEFTKNLYKILAKNSGNVFFSPISIHAILSLASQGSGGKTLEAFNKVLNVPDAKIGALGYKDVMTRLNSVKDVTLLMANKVFLKDKYVLQDNFKNVVTKNYLSEVQAVDFSKAAEAAKSINTWVEEKTNNKIKDLIQSDDLDDDTRLVLVNAIYFKGKWAQPFEASHTKTEKFYLNDNDTIDVQMMNTKKKFFFKNDENLDAKVLELPYSNKDISLIVILPNKRNGIVELEQKLAETDLTKITENMWKPEVHVSLPKFKIEQTIDLKAPLTELGLGEMFGRNADLSGMIDGGEPLFVSKVVQKAFIEVNEEGAEAAAATGMFVANTLSLAIPKTPELFKADHPYAVKLVHKDGQLFNILFQGRVSKPSL